MSNSERKPTTPPSRTARPLITFAVLENLTQGLIGAVRLSQKGLRASHCELDAIDLGLQTLLTVVDRSRKT